MKKILGIFVCTLMIAATVLPVTGTMNIRNVSDVSSNNDTDWWPMFQHDLQLTGFSTSIAPNTNLTLWNTSTGKINEVSSPAVVDDRLYIGMFGEFTADKNSAPYFLPVLQGGSPLSQGIGGLYCLNAITGSPIWDFLIVDGGVGSSPAVDDGKLYFAATYPAYPYYMNTTFYCLDADDGSEIWDFTLGKYSYCSPTVVDGKVYYGAMDRVTEYGKLWCLDADDGSIIWTFTMDYQETMYISSPAVEDGKVFAAAIDILNTQNTTLYCINANTGDEIWNSTLGVLSLGSPTVVDGKVYYGALDAASQQGKLWCLDAEDGSIIWTFTMGYSEWMYVSSPAIAYEKVFAAATDLYNTSNTTFYCINANTGDEIWHCPIEGWVVSSPAVANAKTYIGSVRMTIEEGELFCLDAFNGNLIWSYIPVNGTFSSFAIASGRAYIADLNGIIYAFQDPNEPPTAPTIDGPPEGKVGEEYKFTFHAIDSNGDDVKYFIDWGDDNSEWTNYYPSCTNVTVNHTWSKKGDYTITAKAQDIYGAEGPEGTLTVTIPRSREVNNPLILRLLEWFPNLFPILRQLLEL